MCILSEFSMAARGERTAGKKRATAPGTTCHCNPLIIHQVVRLGDPRPTPKLAANTTHSTARENDGVRKSRFTPSPVKAGHVERTGLGLTSRGRTSFELDKGPLSHIQWSTCATSLPSASRHRSIRSPHNDTSCARTLAYLRVTSSG
jgi:hypothetical protein